MALQGYSKTQDEGSTPSRHQHSTEMTIYCSNSQRDYNKSAS